MTDIMTDLKEEILKMTGDSFDKGAKAAIESTIIALEALYQKDPTITIGEVLNILRLHLTTI